MNGIIREILESESLELEKIYKTIFNKDSNVTQEIIKMYLDSDKEFLLGYFIDNILVGTLSLSLALDAKNLYGKNKYSIIENFAVSDGYRGMGIGKGLLEKAEEISIDNNCYKIVLLSHNKWLDAHKLYKKFGFQDDEQKGFKKYL